MPQFGLEIRKLPYSTDADVSNSLYQVDCGGQFLFPSWLRRLRRPSHVLASGTRAYGGRRCPEPNYCTEKEIFFNVY